MRAYQIETFTEISPSNRYYYAIVECDSVEAASHLYDELEATELERSANVFDLSFVPDDMEFDGEFRYTILLGWSICFCGLSTFQR